MNDVMNIFKSHCFWRRSTRTDWMDRVILGLVIEIFASARYRPLFNIVHFCTERSNEALRKWRGNESVGLKYRLVLSTTAVCKVPGTSLSPGWLKWALSAQRTELKAQHEASSETSFSPALQTAKRLQQAKKTINVSFGLKRNGKYPIWFLFLPCWRLSIFPSKGRMSVFPAQIILELPRMQGKTSE